MHTIARAAALALFAVAATASLPRAQAEQPPPAAAPRLSSIDIPYEAFTLKNGLRVVVHTDRKAPVVAVGVWYGVGSRDEKPGHTGFAHLFEHLMFNGSENHKGEWFKPFEQVGATDQNGTTSFDRTNYFQTVPKTALEMTLWLESDRMGHLLGAIDQAKLDEQRGVVQNEKRQGDNQPYGQVFYSVFAGLFPSGHPYSWRPIGSMEDLNAASLDDVKEWFRAYYGAANAVLVLAGDIDAVTARPLVEKYFAEVDPGPPVARREVAVAIRAANTRDVLKDRVPQARIYRSWIVPPNSMRESVMMGLTASVLGQGKTSKLYKALVYDQKVATDVSAFNGSLEIAGVFQIQVTLKEGQDVADVSRRLDAALADFLKNGPTQGDLDRVRTRAFAGITRGLQSVGGFGKTSWLAECTLYEQDPGCFRRGLAWSDAATPAEVRAVAKEWLSRGWHQVEVVPFGNLTASGADADRSKVPVVDSTPELAFPAIEQGTLPNGAKVVLARRAGVPLVEIGIAFEGGYTADAGRKLGTASFTMGMLDDGTRTRTALGLAAEVEDLGANLFTYASIEASYVRLSALKAKLAPSLALMADVTRNPSFEPKEIDRVRTIWLANIKQEKVEPFALAFRLLPPAIYGAASPYGAPLTGSGTEDSIRSLTRDDMIAFHAERLRPDNATFFVAGDITLAEATAALSQAFAGWTAPASPLREIAKADAARRQGARLILLDRPNAPQSVILAGRATTPAAAPTALAQEVMNTTIGGQFTSRINMNLREDKHWSYGAGSFFANTRGERPWMVYAAVQTDKTIESLAELRRELTEYVGARPMTEQEFTAATARSTRSLPGRFETVSSVLGALIAPAHDGRPLDWTPTLPARYRAMTLEDARAAAKEIVDPAKLVWIVVGDRAKIEKGLRGTGIAPLEIWDEDGNPATETAASR